MAGFRDRLRLDDASGAWLDETRRYMLIRPEALMGTFRRLPARERAMALEALAESIFEQGSDSARAYVAMGGEGEKLLDIIEASAPELGWGRWRFTKHADGLDLAVGNSPFAAGFGRSETPVCAAIVGMLKAVAHIVIARPMQARETACAAMGSAECRFEARPAAG